MLRFLHWVGIAFWLGAQMTFMVWGPQTKAASLEAWAHTWKMLAKVQGFLIAPAAALATRWWAGADAATDVWRVDVPGGTLRVRALPGQEVELAGPAVLVADGVTTLA